MKQYILNLYTIVILTCIPLLASEPMPITPESKEDFIAFITNVNNDPLPVLIAISDDPDTYGLIAKLEPQFAGLIDFIQLNTREHASITKFLVRSTPTFYFLKNGKPIHPPIEGSLSEEQLIAKLLSLKEQSDDIDRDNANKLEAFKTTVLQSSQSFLLYFTASWCAPCQKIKPIIEDIFAKYNTDQFHCVKFDFDNDKSIAELLKIQSIPSFIFMKNGKELYRFIGVTSKQAIEELISILFQAPINQETLDAIVKKGSQEIQTLFEKNEPA